MSARVIAALVLACVAAPFARAQTAPPAPARAPLDLRFAPAEGSKVWRTLTIDQSLVLQELVQTSATGSQSSQDQISLSTHAVLRALDQYRKIDAGRPLVLQRRFDEFTWRGDARLPTGPAAIKAQSPLKGTSVVYTWVPEENAYGKYYDAREAPEEVLLGLAEDLDLRALLPQHPVAAGESWSVPSASLVDLFGPCGRMGLDYSEVKQKNLLRTLRLGMAGELGEFFGGESKGQCTCTLASIAAAPAAENVSAGQLATIELDFALENKVDQRALVQAQLSGVEIASGQHCLRASARWSFTGKGRLVWDLSARRAAHLELDGQQRMSFELELQVREQPSTTQKMTLAGGLKSIWEIEDPVARAAKAAQGSQGQK